MGYTEAHNSEFILSRKIIIVSQWLTDDTPFIFLRVTGSISALGSSAHLAKGEKIRQAKQQSRPRNSGSGSAQLMHFRHAYSSPKARLTMRCCC